MNLIELSEKINRPLEEIKEEIFQEFSIIILSEYNELQQSIIEHFGVNVYDEETKEQDIHYRKKIQEYPSEIPYTKKIRNFFSEIGYREEPRKNFSETGYREEPRKNSSEIGYREEPRKNSSEIGYREEPRKYSSKIVYTKKPRKISSEIEYREEPRKISSKIVYTKKPRKISSEIVYTKKIRKYPSEIAYTKKPRKTSSETAYTKKLLDYCIKNNFLMFIDTCSLLNDGFKAFYKIYSERKGASDWVLYIPYVVMEELRGIASGGRKGKRVIDRADDILAFIEKEKYKGNIVEVGDEEDKRTNERGEKVIHADRVIIEKLIYFRNDSRSTLFITQDFDVTTDVLKQNDLRSSKSNAVILVKKIGEGGVLVNNTEETVNPPLPID